MIKWTRTTDEFGNAYASSDVLVPFPGFTGGLERFVIDRIDHPYYRWEVVDYYTTTAHVFRTLKGAKAFCEQRA